MSGDQTIKQATPVGAENQQQQPSSSVPRRTSGTGLKIRERTLRKLDIGVAALTVADAANRAEPAPASSSSHESGASTASSSSASRFGRTILQKSASFVTLASLPLQTDSSSSSTSTRSKRSILTDIRGKSRRSSYNPSLFDEDKDALYRKYNLIALPPPGHIRPVLLPTYAVKTPEEAISVRIDGFIEIWPKSAATSQRVFNQMVRQMTNLPRLPRQQPTPPGMAPPPHATPWATSSSSSMSSSPLHEDTDDAVFFPDIPYGVPKAKVGEEVESPTGDRMEGLTERLTERAFSLGAPEKAIGKVLQSVGALPVEGKLEDGHHEEEEQSEKKAEVRQEETEADQSGRQHLLGGSSFWSDRPREEVERLWHTLEHRLRCFWTYRKPHQEVTIEIVPVFQGEQTQRDQSWTLDEYEHFEAPERSEVAPLLAITRLTSDVHGLFSTELMLTREKIQHYLSHYHSQTTRTPGDLMYLRVRACMRDENQQTIRSRWQSLRISLDDSSSVRVICDVDDTAKHTDVLAGARTVTRNVFARPFEEVQVAGVSHWFDSLCFEGMVSGFHFVTNAPAEMYGIVKAYLSSAQLPSGHLALKHYFSPTKSTSWMQTYLQPAASRKRQNLLRCLDDFPNSKFVLIGDSGEMDLEVYCELAKERPQQIRGIWIRDVGNVTMGAKSMVSGSFAVQKSGSLLQAPPAAHLEGQQEKRAIRKVPAGNCHSDSDASNSTGPKRTMKRPSTLIPRAGSPLENEYEARLAKALAMLPKSTRFRFWSSGQDAVQESVEYVREIKKSASTSQHVA